MVSISGFREFIYIAGKLLMDFSEEFLLYEGKNAVNFGKKPGLN
jgi:hypothetical protein